MTNMPVPRAQATPADPTAAPRDGFIAILLIFLRLGVTSFGGPIAHIGYLREEFVTRRNWMLLLSGGANRQMAFGYPRMSRTI